MLAEIVSRSVTWPQVAEMAITVACVVLIVWILNRK